MNTFIQHIEIILYVQDQEQSALFYEKLLRQKPSLHVPGMTEFTLSAGCKLGLMPEAGIAPLLDEATFGEASDICQISRPGHPIPGVPVDPVDLQVTDPKMGPDRNYISVRPFWSNSRGECIPIPPVVGSLVGTPSFANQTATFVSSATPITLDATYGSAGANIASLSYRIYPSSTQPGKTLPFTVTAGPKVVFNLTGPDGEYTIEYFAVTKDGFFLHKLSSLNLTLDNTAPLITMTTPVHLGTYDHGDVLTLSYVASDGAGSGLATLVGRMNGSTTLAGHGLANGQAIDLLTELPLGSFTFSVDATDNVTNARTASAKFVVVATAGGIIREVDRFATEGKFKNAGIPNSLRAKLVAASSARDRGQCATAANIYDAFLSELQAQLGTGVDMASGLILRSDAAYLKTVCP